MWSYYLAFRYRQVKRRFGDKNPHLTFYVIRRLPPGGGLFSNVWHVISHIDKVKERGWVPVVDMEGYSTFYNQPDEINETFNAWEYYFEQPAEYSSAPVSHWPQRRKSIVQPLTRNCFVKDGACWGCRREGATIPLSSPVGIRGSRM